MRTSAEQQLTSTPDSEMDHALSLMVRCVVPSLYNEGLADTEATTGLHPRRVHDEEPDRGMDQHFHRIGLQGPSDHGV